MILIASLIFMTSSFSRLINYKDMQQMTVDNVCAYVLNKVSIWMIFFNFRIFTRIVLFLSIYRKDHL